MDAKVRVIRCGQSEIEDRVAVELAGMLAEIDKGKAAATIRFELTDYQATITVRFPPLSARPPPA